MIQIIGDIKRAVFSRSFLIAYGGMVLCLLIGAFSDALSVFRMEERQVMYGFHRNLLLNALGNDIFIRRERKNVNNTVKSCKILQPCDNSVTFWTNADAIITNTNTEKIRKEKKENSK